MKEFLDTLATLIISSYNIKLSRFWIRGTRFIDSNIFGSKT